MGNNRVARDDISGYVRGLRLPTQGKARQIAAALEVGLRDLIPSATPSADRVRPEMEMRSAGDGHVWFRVEKRLSVATALEVMQMIQADEATDQS